MGIAIETMHVPWRLVASALLQVVDDSGCDLIVMSSRGYRDESHHNGQPDC